MGPVKHVLACAFAGVAAAVCVAPPVARAAHTCVAPPSGIVAWWRGEGNAADAARDNDGVLINGAAFTAGEVGQAFAVNGVNQGVTVVHNGILAPTTAMTEMAWFFVTARVGPFDPVALGVNGQTENGFTIEFLNDSLVFWIYLNGTFYGAGSPAAIPLGTWVHAAATYTGSEVILYINGARVSSAPAPRATVASTDLQWIGSSPILSRYLNGKVDEVALFNRALSAKEIKSIYAAADAGMCALPPQPFGGAVVGALPAAGKIVCNNLTTGASVTIAAQKNVRTWDCVAAGLTVSTGDKVSVSANIRGIAE